MSVEAERLAALIRECALERMSESEVQKMAKTLTTKTVGGRQGIEAQLVADFTPAMLTKLERARQKGRGGWERPEECTVMHLWDCLHEHMSKSNLDMVDVANIAAMIWHRLGHNLGELEQLQVHVAQQLLAPVRPEYLEAEAEITRLNWMTQVKLAHAYRAAGFQIPTRMEEECGFVVQHLLAIAREHGMRWRDVAQEELNAAMAAHTALFEAGDDGSQVKP